jgi:hypothetical protein
MQVLEKNELFTEVSAEESATISGGGPVSYLQYIQLGLTTPAGLGGAIVPARIAAITQTGWNILINQTGAVNSVPSL